MDIDGLGDKLVEQIDRGRGPQADERGPFFDLISSIAFGENSPTHLQAKIQAIVDSIIELLSEDIRSLNFWERPVQVSQLEGKLQRVLVLSRIPELKDNRDQLVTEVLALARRRERSILNDKSGGE